MILETLERLELDNNAIVIFTRDNGGETNVTSNAPLRAGKSSLYEGGIRVPLIVRWPEVVPHNTVCDQPTGNVDFYPTLLECAGVEPDPRQKLDGISILPILKDPPSLRVGQYAGFDPCLFCLAVQDQPGSAGDR
jgi:arylsulfatase A-like enzyme